MEQTGSTWIPFHIPYGETRHTENCKKCRENHVIGMD